MWDYENIGGVINNLNVRNSQLKTVLRGFTLAGFETQSIQVTTASKHKYVKSLQLRSIKHEFP